MYISIDRLHRGMAKMSFFIFFVIFVCGNALRMPNSRIARWAKEVDTKVGSRYPAEGRRSRTRAMQLQSADVVIDASYNLAAGAATLGLACGFLEDRKGPLAKVFGGGAVLLTVFGAFVAFQTATLSFKFDDKSFSLIKNDGTLLGENVVVGGENKWRYDSFVNWKFLPSESFPILVYFRETQTPEKDWVEAPIVVDELKGQAHFFPAIASSEQLKSNFENNGCKHLAESDAVQVKSTDRLVM